MSNFPQIRPVPTAKQIVEKVDVFLHEDCTDAEAKEFIDVIFAVANPEDDTSWELTSVAVRHAFAKTEAFERAFREFAGFGDDQVPYMADRYIVSADKEM